MAVDVSSSPSTRGNGSYPAVKERYGNRRKFFRPKQYKQGNNTSQTMYNRRPEYASHKVKMGSLKNSLNPITGIKSSFPVEMQGKYLNEGRTVLYKKGHNIVGAGFFIVEVSTT